MNKSFTLVELIVVIAIIAILAAIIAPNAFRAIEKAKISRLRQDIKTLKTAAMAYYADVGLWPPDVCPAEDPGFMRWDAYQTRCCGQDYDKLPPNYAQIIQDNWDGPYLEKFPRYNPWGGSYDWEWWPSGSWGLPPGCYVSARPKYNSIQFAGSCGYVGDPQDTDIPDPIEVKLQQEGIDEHHPAGVDVPSNHVIMCITKF